MDRRTVLVDGLIDGGTVKNLSQESGYQTPNPRQRERGNLFRWSLAITLMIVIHGFWWFWLSPHIGESVAPAPRATTFRIVTGDMGQRIWTPTVLALPSEIGFSGTVMTNEIGEGPSIRTPQGPVHYLEREIYESVADDGDGVWTRPPLVVRPPPPPGVSVDRDPAVSTTSRPGLRIEFDGNRFEDAGLAQEISVVAGTGSWALSAWVEWKEDGRIGHAFLESSSERPPVDQAVMRILHRWRPASSPAPGAGVLTLRFESPEETTP